MATGMDNLAPSQGFDFYSAGLASGRTDIFDPFLGPSPRVPDGNVYDKRNTAKFNLPEDKMGKNLYLRDTMEDFMLTAAWTFWTERIMPWYKTDQIHVQWSEWENNPAYMGVTPHQTTSRVVTQKHTIRKASIIRRGIAAEFEELFITSPTGRASFWATLKQMARSVQETANVEVLRALLYCHRFQQQYTLQYGVVAKDDLDAWLERRAERFMISQKEEKGLEIINTLIDQEQELWGGKSNVWILSRDVMDHCDVIPPGKTWFFLGGQEAVDRLNGRRIGPAAAGNTMGNMESLVPMRMIKDTPVFIAKSYAVEGIGKAELLSRIVEIGIYNLMVDRTRDFSSYRTEGRHIKVYNNQRDAWSEISLIDAIKNCAIWNAKGELRDIFKGPGSGDLGIDGEYDFLSKRVGNKRQNIRYVGEMDPAFLDTTYLLNMAQTLVQAAGFHDQNNIMKLVDALNSGRVTDAQVKRLSSLIGKDNPFAAKLKDVITKAAGSPGTRPAILDTRKGPKDKDKSASRRPQIDLDTTAVKKTIQTWFDDVLGAVVPSTHEAQFRAIASRADEAWETRSKQVKQLITDCHTADPKSTGTLTSIADVDKWHAACERQLNAKLSKLGVSAAGVQQVGGEVYAPIRAGTEVVYFDANAELPEGYSWAGPVVTHDVNDGLEAYPEFLKAIASIDEPVDASSGTGAGTGFYSAAGGRRFIGASAVGVPGSYTDPEAEKARSKATKDIEGKKPKGYEMLRHQLEEVWKASAPLYLRLCATFLLGLPVHRDVMVNLARSHVAVPLGFVLFRSHCTYKTRYGIKCAVNGETGYTMFGNSMMMVAHEAARQVGMMHYTAYLSAVVMYPKNVFVVEDIFCQRYLGGMGVTFWTVERYQNAQGDRRRADIICAPLPPLQRELDEKVDMRGRWYTEHDLQLVTQDRFDRPCYPGAARMNAIFKWYDAVRKDRGGHRGKVAPNYVCWQGMEWYYNTKNNQWDSFTVETGCMGPKVYPGCGKVRNGQLKHLVDPCYDGGRGVRF